MKRALEVILGLFGIVVGIVLASFAPQWALFLVCMGWALGMGMFDELFDECSLTHAECEAFV